MENKLLDGEKNELSLRINAASIKTLIFSNNFYKN